MLHKELVEDSAKRLISLRLITIACRITAHGNLSQQTLSLGARRGGGQCSVLTDSDATRPAPPSSQPILKKIDFPSRRCDLEAEATKLKIPYIRVIGIG